MSEACQTTLLGISAETQREVLVGMLAPQPSTGQKGRGRERRGCRERPGERDGADPCKKEWGHRVRRRRDPPQVEASPSEPGPRPTAAHGQCCQSTCGASGAPWGLGVCLAPFTTNLGGGAVMTATSPPGLRSRERMRFPGQSPYALDSLRGLGRCASSSPSPTFRKGRRAWRKSQPRALMSRDAHAEPGSEP